MSQDGDFHAKRFAIAGLLQEAQRLLPNNYRVTLLCRCTDEQFGDEANMLFSDDPDLAHVAQALQPAIEKQKAALVLTGKNGRG